MVFPWFSHGFPIVFLCFSNPKLQVTLLSSPPLRSWRCCSPWRWSTPWNTNPRWTAAALWGTMAIRRPFWFNGRSAGSDKYGAINMELLSLLTSCVSFYSNHIVGIGDSNHPSDKSMGGFLRLWNWKTMGFLLLDRWTLDDFWWELSIFRNRKNHSSFWVICRIRQKYGTTLV